MHRRGLIWFLFILLMAGCAGSTATDSPAPVSTDTKTNTQPSAKTVETETGDRTASTLAGREAAGEHYLIVNTRNPDVQALVDRAMVQTFGFNHAEANKLFKQAAGLDPDCAACYWGAAYVLGPNINAPMEPTAVTEAFELSRKAHDLRDKAHPRNRALIEALVARYEAEPPEDRAPLDEAYADAMRRVARRHPNDALVQALLAEALMDLHPWQYWKESGEPEPYTPEILTALRGALRIHPDHLLANHLHIHAMEMSPNPKEAEASADRLRRLAPGAGHLLHMPAHIYMRIGRYADAAEVNRKAIEHDQAYKQRAHPEGIYPLGYMPHNRHFLVVALARSGQSRAALEHAFKLAQEVDQDKMREPGFGTLQHFWTMPLYIVGRFGKWDEILNQPSPDAGLKYPKGVWHYARGRALAAKGRLVEAQEHLASLQRLAKHPFLEDITIWDVNATARLLEIAEKVLAGELAYAGGDLDAAIEHLREAVKREDALIYEEPSSWYYPARQSLGLVLMEAGRYEDAERVYRKDLDKHYNNGWSLLGLKQVLEKQGRDQEAENVEKQFQQAWAQADFLITRSRI